MGFRGSTPHGWAGLLLAAGRHCTAAAGVDWTVVVFESRRLGAGDNAGELSAEKKKRFFYYSTE